MIKYKSLKQEKCEPRYKYDCYIGEKYLDTQFIQSIRYNIYRFLNFPFVSFHRYDWNPSNDANADMQQSS